MGPGPRFELGRKAPQASMLPSYTTPAAGFVFLFFWVPFCSATSQWTNALFLLSEDFALIGVFSG